MRSTSHVKLGLVCEGLEGSGVRIRAADMICGGCGGRVPGAGDGDTALGAEDAGEWHDIGRENAVGVDEGWPSAAYQEPCWTKSWLSSPKNFRMPWTISSNGVGSARSLSRQSQSRWDS